MPTKVTAKNGDCLCGIAVDAGFLNCEPLRALPENSALLTRDLKDGDEVTVPDLVVEDFPKAIDTKHTFKLKSSPPFNIRFVHGSSSPNCREDAETATLHVSNFVTNLGGATGLAAFPAGYGFNEDGHQDPDTFMVEVWDPAAGGPVNVKLEALKPGYTADPGSGKLTATSFTPFTEAGRKIDALVCNAAGAASTYRSKYMRLVVDDQDLASVAGQLLLVSDLADGLGTGAATDNDSVEILDQMVQATYTIDRCTGSPKCKVTKVVDIGGSERQRVRVHFHAFRKDPGVDTMPTGVTATDIKQHLRRRTFKWYRRVYAQAELAPKLESMNVIDPPAENMLCLSHSHGRPVVAGTGTVATWLAKMSANSIIRSLASVTGTIATLDFRIKTATRDLPVNVVFDGGETPLEAGAFIVESLPATFKGEALPTPRATNATNPSCDVLITADNGERVTLLDVVLSAGIGMTVDVPRVNLMSVLSGDSDIDASTSFISIDMKRLLRSVAITDDAMFCLVVGQFSTPSLRGQAFLPCLGADPPFQPDLPFRSSTIMAYTAANGPVLDGGDNLPFTSPHESTHTLCDLIHTKPSTNHSRTELMAGGTSVANTVTASKRLCDGPYLIKMQKNGTTTQTTQNVRLAETLRTGGAAKMEAW